jgi:chaperonin GroES
MAQNLKPLGDRLVVKPKVRDETTRAGIVLPDTASERPQQGEVLAVGPGRIQDNGSRIPMEIRPGETVLFAKYSGTELKVEEDDLLVLNERDVLAIMENGGS